MARRGSQGYTPGMARLPLAALLALCLPGLAAGDDWSSQVGGFAKFQKSEGGALPAPAAPEASPPAMSGSVDMSRFLERLEDLTLDTRELRALLGRIGVSFRPPTASANAQYSLTFNHLYLPDAFKAQGREAVRYDLASNELSTVIHELTHASADILASGSAAGGTPGREHHDALGMLTTQVRGGAAWAYYPASKADELAGYYMGCAIGDVADAANILRIYNVSLGGAKAPDEGEAARLGATLLLLDQTPRGARPAPVPEAWTAMQRRGLGHCDVGDSAQFEGRPIGVEPDFGVKGMLYQNVLGLKPPLSLKELADRLNDPSRRSPRLDAMRDEIRAARLKSARAAR